MPFISVVMPCLNEEESIGECIRDSIDALEKTGYEFEVLIVDNGSTDNSIEVSRQSGARVIQEPRKGYGSAYQRGFKEAKGDVIVMGDSDGTYPFEAIPEFIAPIIDGKADIVMGSRLKGEIMPGAMPWLHKHIGNPALTWILNQLFNINISDSHCGMRAFSREAIHRMDLKTTGMEFASEMVIKGAKAGLRFAEVPIQYQTRKGGSPKLNSLSDGWRHLRFMFIYEHLSIFLIPGMSILFFGLGLVLFSEPYRYHTMISGSLFSILGVQVILHGIYARIFTVINGLDKSDKVTEWLLKYNTLERGMVLGLMIFLSGAIIGLYIFSIWIRSGFEELSEVKSAVVASTFGIIGIQMIFSSLFISVLLLGKREDV